MKVLHAVWVGAWSLGLLTAGPALGQALNPIRADVRAKLDDALIDKVETTPMEGLIPVYVVLHAQVSKEALETAALLNKNRDARRQAVMSLLKTVAADTQPRVLNIIDDARRSGEAGPVVYPLWIANLVVFEATSAVIFDVAALPEVEMVFYDRPIGPEVFPVEPVSDPPNVAAPTCGLNLIGAPSVWNDFGITGKDIVVGVIDTGLCITHPDIAAQVWINPGEIPGNGIDDDGNGFIDDIHGWNFQSNNNNVADSGAGTGHGSHTAGTVAGNGAQGTQTGVAPGARIMVLKFVNSLATGQPSVWASMQYAMDNNADVISASLGWPHSSNPNRRMWRSICEGAIAAGVTVIYAAGNEGGCCQPYDAVRTPGDVPDVITVGAVHCSDALASFSSWGPVTWQNVSPFFDWPFPPGKLKPTVSGPGVATTSLNMCSGYTNKDGTSMSTPHVAGVAALMLEANPNLSHHLIKQILKSTSKDLGDAGPDKKFGWGRVNAYAAVQKALDYNCCGGAGLCFEVDLEAGVGLGDYAALPDCLTGPDGFLTEDCVCVDSDVDFDVDLKDVAAFFNAFGQ